MIRLKYKNIILYRSYTFFSETDHIISIKIFANYTDKIKYVA